MLLRPRQKLFVERSLAALSTRDNTLGVAPTGAGKTIMLSAVTGRMTGDGARACVLAHRDELTSQNREKFARVNPGTDTSVVDATTKSWEGQVTFAMAPTLARAANLAAMPKLDLLVIDEAHHAVAESYRRIIDRVRDANPDARVFGVTATPNRGDRKGLREVFDNVADQVRLGELIASGHLVPPRTFVIDVGVQDELRSVRKTMSDYDMTEVAEIMDRAPVTDEVIRHWKEKAGDRQTVVFCSTVAHAEHVTEAFLEVGVPAALITGTLEAGARKGNRLWELHIKRYGPPLIRLDSAAPAQMDLPTFTLGALLDDKSPMPDDIIGPRVLTPGGLLVLGGAPKVGKSDLLIALLVHMAAGVPFLGFTPPRSLRIFYLQAEIQYHYLRERMQQIGLPPELIAAARDNLIVTPKLRMLLDAEGSARVAEAIRAAFPDEPLDILCIDPIRNLFDGGPDGGGENDNAAMMFFLKDRVEVLRDHVNPDCGVILVHHTKKLSKHQVKEDPFLALSGASALRGFYTTGLILHRPEEDSTQRRLEIELRNGPALPAKLVDKVKGKWVEINPMNERLVRPEVGAKHDAERDRKRDVILSILLEEAAEGRLYTINQFAEAFENKAGLGGKDTIRDRIAVQATKGAIKFIRDGAPYGLGPSRSRFGYLCVEGMVMPTGGESVDPATGEVTPGSVAVLPTHYKSPQTGALLEVENSHVWVYPEGDRP